MPTRILATVVACIAIVCLFAGAVIITDSVNDASAPLITTVLGVFTLVVTQLVTVRGIDSGVRKVDGKVERVLNGEMDEKIRRNVQHVLTEREKGSTVVAGNNANDDTP